MDWLALIQREHIRMSDLKIVSRLFDRMATHLEQRIRPENWMSLERRGLVS